MPRPDNWSRKTASRRVRSPGALALRHQLSCSPTSVGRRALRENTVICSLSKQRILLDEAKLSDASDQIVAQSLLKSSAISGKLAEPEYFTQCEFTQVEALVSELGVSQISGKRYRLDEEVRSVVSGILGHRTEFKLCEVTQQPFAPGEGENCEITGYLVAPSVLMRCAVSGKLGIPSELEQCAASGNWAQKKYLVTSRCIRRTAVGALCLTFCQGKVLRALGRPPVYVERPQISSRRSADLRPDRCSGAL